MGSTDLNTGDMEEIPGSGCACRLSSMINSCSQCVESTCSVPAGLFSVGPVLRIRQAPVSEELTLEDTGHYSTFKISTAMG